MLRCLCGRDRRSEAGNGVCIGFMVDLLTPSFSVIAPTPWTEDVSKVSMDWSRCWGSKNIVVSPSASSTPMVGRDIRRDPRGPGGYYRRFDSRTERIALFTRCQVSSLFTFAFVFLPIVFSSPGGTEVMVGRSGNRHRGNIRAIPWKSINI